MSVYHTPAVPEESRRGHQIPLGLSFRWLLDIMQVLGIKSGPPRRAASVLNCEFSLRPLILSATQCFRYWFPYSHFQCISCSVPSSPCFPRRCLCGSYPRMALKWRGFFFFFFNIPCDSVAFNRVELGSNLISEASEP